MSRTEITGKYIKDGTIKKEDLDTTTPGHSVITSLRVTPPLTMTYTGADEGTGDVTIGLGEYGTNFSLVIAHTDKDISVYRNWVSLPFKKIEFDNLNEMEDGKWRPSHPGIYGIYIQVSASKELYSTNFRIKINGEEKRLIKSFQYASAAFSVFFIHVKQDDNRDKIEFQIYNTRNLKIYKDYTHLYIWKIADIGAIR